MRTVVFVVPFFMEATLRFVSGTARLPDIRLGLVSQDPLELLGLVALYEARGDSWKATDAEIDHFLKTFPA